MKLFFLFVLIFGFISLVGVTGKIVDEQQKPISGVYVFSNTEISISDSLGYFTLGEKYVNSLIRFHKIGFKDVGFIRKNIPTSIILKRDVISIERVNVRNERIGSSGEMDTANKRIIEVQDDQLLSLPELLATKAEIHQKGNDLAGENSEISLLGNKTKHTLVMLDGIPLNMSGTSFDISSIPTAGIERIEILSGNSSAIAGSGAVGGVINLISKKPENEMTSPKTKGTVSIGNTIGNLGLNSQMITHSYSSNKINYRILWKRLFTRNDFKYKYIFTNEPYWRKRENNHKEIYDLNLHFSKITKLMTIGYTYFLHDYFKELPGEINQLSTFDECHLAGRNWKHILNLNKKVGKFDFQSDIYSFLDKSIFDNTKSSNNIYPIIGKTNFSKSGIKFKIAKINDLISDLGISYNREKYSYFQTDSLGIEQTNNSIKPVSQRNASLYVKGEKKVSVFPFVVKADLFLRNDFFDRTGKSELTSHFSSRGELEIFYESLITYSAGINLANAFLRPSFYDLYWKASSQVIGNPNLKSESSNSREIYLKIAYFDQRIRIAIHQNRINNMIFWHKSIYAWKPDNIGKVLITNFTLESHLEWSKFIRSSIFYQKTTALDKTKAQNGEESNFYDKRIIYTPEFLLKCNLGIKISYFDVNFEYQQTGKQYYTQDNLHGIIPEYDLLNCESSLNFRIKKVKMRFLLHGKNLFDKHYEIHTKNPKPGFNWSIGSEMKYEF